MTASEQHTREMASGRPGLLLGPLGPMFRGRVGEVASPELAAGVQALVSQVLSRSQGLEAVAEAADCIRLLWDVRATCLWLPAEGGWQALPSHPGAPQLQASCELAEALSVAATSAQRLDWPSAPHGLASHPGEALGSATFQPLLVGEHLQGVLSLHFGPSRGFPPSDGPLLVAVARPLGSALAWLEAQAELQAARAALFAEVERNQGLRHAAEATEQVHQAKVARLQEADQTKTDFLAKLSHELRSPLTTITGFGSMLEDGVAGGMAPEQALMVRRMLTAADAITWLVEDLLDLSRLRAGTFRLEPKPTHLAELLLELGATMAPLVDRAQIKLKFELGEPLPALAIDPRRIAQALRNLLTNAIKHAPKASVVAVRLVGNAEGQRLEVRDQGPGVRPEDVQAIFEPYRQLGPCGQGDGGLGLGLAITRQLVQAHGGEVGLCPHATPGACFYMQLPHQAPQASEA